MLFMWLLMTRCWSGRTGELEQGGARKGVLAEGLRWATDSKRGVWWFWFCFCFELAASGKDATDCTLERRWEYPAVLGDFIDDQSEIITAFGDVVVAVVVLVAFCGRPLDHAEGVSNHLGGSCLFLGGTLEAGGLGLE
jgi:hypothetical protein